MNRSVRNSMMQTILAVQRSPLKEECSIAQINYVNKRIQVKDKSYNGPRRVPVAAHIRLGTSQNKVFFPGDLATVELIQDRWICTGIRHKRGCLPIDRTGVDTVVDITDQEADDLTNDWTNIDIPSADSFDFGDFLAELNPDFTFPPPVEVMGDLTLPELEVPPIESLICGIPACTDCAPDGFTSGMVLILSSDDDHAVCWKWGFRLGGCTGSPALQSIFDYDTTLFGGAPVAQQNAKGTSIVRYTYTATLAAGSSYGKMKVIDCIDPTTPVEVGSIDLTIPGSTFSLGFISHHGTFVYVGMSKGGSSNEARIYVYDVTDPTTPSLSYSWTLTGFSIVNEGSVKNDCRIWESGGNLYMAFCCVSSGVGFGTIRILDITNPAVTPTVVGTINGGTGETLIDLFYNNGFLYFGATGANPTLGKIWIYDVTTPATPVFKSMTDLGGNSTTKGIRANDNYLVVVLNVLSGSPKMYILDITDPTAPSLLSTTTLSHRVRDVDLCSTFAYILSNTGPGFVDVYDISDPTTPVAGTSVTLDTGSVTAIGWTVHIEGSRTFVIGIRGAATFYPTLTIL